MMRRQRKFLYVLGLVERINLVSSKRDVRKWKLEAFGTFSCKYIHNFLNEGSSDPSFSPAKFIWNAKVPPKMKVLGWLVAHQNECFSDASMEEANLLVSPH